MERHEGATMIKTFRGMLTSSQQDTIVLHNNNGEIGYRIVKFQIMPGEPGGTSDFEGVTKIFKVSQTAFDSSVDFNDNTLLAAAYYQDNVGEHYPSSIDIIFDTEIFNQDIYISYVKNTGSQLCNYYIELEQFKLDLNESTVATLKDIRNERATITG